MREQQLAGTISDGDAERRVVQLRAELRAVIDRHSGPVREAKAKRRPGNRLHYGLIAQEVKAALDAAGVDAAFWKEAQDGSQSLAYTELIAPIIRAIQEHDETLRELADRVAALEPA